MFPENSLSLVKRFTVYCKTHPQLIVYQRNMLATSISREETDATKT